MITGKDLIRALLTLPSLDDPVYVAKGDGMLDHVRRVIVPSQEADSLGVHRGANGSVIALKSYQPPKSASAVRNLPHVKGDFVARLITEARALSSGKNTDYDRALIELVLRTLGLTEDDRPAIAALVLAATEPNGS